MNPKNPTSPKVIAAVVAGLLLSAILSHIDSITPQMFAFLGPWAPFVYGLVITLIMGAAAYWKTDPLRVLPGDQPADATGTDPAASTVTTSSAPATIIVKPNTPVDLNASASAALAAATPSSAVTPTPAVPAEQLAGTPAPATAAPESTQPVS